VMHYIPVERQNVFKKIFWLLQVMNVGMLVSFPLQGYGLYSIIFSAVHTTASFVFVLLFWQYNNAEKTPSLLLAKISLVCLVISAAGPFSLAYIMANDLRNTYWYNCAIYYYLHFQYNGFFFFGIASLFVKTIEGSAKINITAIKHGWIWWFVVAVFPAYFLSILYNSPGLGFNLIALLSAGVQIAAFIKLVLWLRSYRKAIEGCFRSTMTFLVLILCGLGVKFILQFLSAFPAISRMAFEFRPITIAYLHLVLLGVVTTFLLTWYAARDYFGKMFLIIFKIFFIAFVIMELVLIITPWWNGFSEADFPVVLLLTACLCCFFIVFDADMSGRKAETRN
jgi:hypothetical protein